MRPTLENSDNLDPLYKPKRKNKAQRSWKFWVFGLLSVFIVGFVGFVVGIVITSRLIVSPPIVEYTVPTTLPVLYVPERLQPPPLRAEELGTDADARLDLVFVLDTTGSMSDELAQLQNNIMYISEQISKLPQNVHVRYAYIAYKDRGDSYVTSSLAFTTNVESFQANLANLYADGGGDTPEALEEALSVAVAGLSWRDENTVKLMFIVTDAAPHLDYTDDVPYTQTMLSALDKGIKIHAIASSGLEPDGEYILRQIAQATFGHFIFLTYDQAGTPNTSGDYRPDLSVGEPASANSNGDYSVEQLDELVLRLIRDELVYVTR